MSGISPTAEELSPLPSNYGYPLSFKRFYYKNLFESYQKIIIFPSLTQIYQFWKENA